MRRTHNASTTTRPPPLLLPRSADPPRFPAMRRASVCCCAAACFPRTWRARRRPCAAWGVPPLRQGHKQRGDTTLDGIGGRERAGAAYDMAIGWMPCRRSPQRRVDTRLDAAKDDFCMIAAILVVSM
jgi:hypothetical protein